MDSEVPFGPLFQGTGLASGGAEDHGFDSAPSWEIREDGTLTVLAVS